jgi:hypothetical protein
MISSFSFLYKLTQPIFDRRVLAHLRQNGVKEQSALEEYLNLLSFYKVSEAAFDKEMLRRIDAGWDVPSAPRGGGKPSVPPPAFLMSKAS